MSAAKVACRAVKCGEGGAKAGFQWRGRSLRRSRARANSGSDGCDSLGKAGRNWLYHPEGLDRGTLCSVTLHIWTPHCTRFTCLHKGVYSAEHTRDMVVQTLFAVYTHVPLTFTGGKRRVLSVHHLRPSRAGGRGVPEPQGPQASSHLQLGSKLTQAAAASSCSEMTPPPRLPLELWV